MHPERPRARRYSIAASIELTDLESETHLREQTSDLSLFGCHVDTRSPFPTGTRVRIRIIHRGANFRAFGKVANAPLDGGMGIVFTGMEQNDQFVLEKWIAELREK